MSFLGGTVTDLAEVGRYTWKCFDNQKLNKRVSLIIGEENNATPQKNIEPKKSIESIPPIIPISPILIISSCEPAMPQNTRVLGQEFDLQ